MPFSWDQIIPGHHQTFKQKTIALYIDENRRLDGAGGVREYMKEHHDFDKRLVLLSSRPEVADKVQVSLRIAASSQNGASRRTITLGP
jgi:hypothetical protein